MELHLLSARAMEIRQKYESLGIKRYGRQWTREELMLGDLAKLVMSKECVRAIADANTKLTHELADCLWSIRVLSKTLGVDLEAAFLQTLGELEESIQLSTRDAPSRAQVGGAKVGARGS